MKKNALFLSKFMLLLAAVLLFACQNNNNKKEAKDEILDSTAITKADLIKVNYYKIPCPSELFWFIKDFGATYSRKISNPVNNASNYNNNIKKALNFGIYASDLFYASVFKQNQETMKFYKQVKKLGNELNIVEGFDDKISKRVDKNLNNSDSLFTITSEANSNAISYLEGLGKSNILPYITLGGWIESVYIASKQVKVFSPKDPIVSIIIDQNYLLDNIIGLYGSVEQEESIKEYTVKLKEIQKVYDEADDIITKKQYEKIVEKISSLRNEFIK
ncbi:MAG: hypothetical protein ACOYOV_05650 [Bacteroidales bacterium]